jgi:hypothetical protein
MKLTKEQLAECQDAKDTLDKYGMLSRDGGHRIQNKIDNAKSGNGRGQWGKRFKEENCRDLVRLKTKGN